MKRKTNVKDKPQKRPRGAQTKYDPKYDKIAKRLAEKGIHLKEIYKTMGIGEPTGIRWRKTYPSFAIAIKEGRANLKCNLVEKSLLQLATGHEHYTQKAVVVSNGAQMGSHVEKVKVKEYYPPQITAIKYYLDNRKSLKLDPVNGWADKQVIDQNISLEYKVIPDPELEPDEDNK